MANSRKDTPDEIDLRSAQMNLKLHYESPVNRDSISSSSSDLSNARERRRNKILVEETSFNKQTTKRSCRNERQVHLRVKDDKEAISSSSRNSENYGSSESDDISSSNVVSKTNGDASNRASPMSSKVSELAKSKKDVPTDGTSRPTTVSSIDNMFLDIKNCKTSEDMSYREKIRDRFMSVKEKAVESVSRPQSRAHSRLKILTTKQAGTLIEDLFRREEEEINDAIKRHQKDKLLWKDTLGDSTEMKPLEEANKFFCETSEIQTVEEHPTEEKSLSTNNTAKENDSSSKFYTSELLGLKDDWEMCEFKKPELTKPSGQNRESNILFCPSTKKVVLEEKLEPGLGPRFVEQEGQYVGRKIQVPEWVKNKMEQRLLMNPDGKKWFEMDGELMCKVNPLASVRIRQRDGGNESRVSLTTFIPAALSDRKYRYMDLTGSAHYVLDIDISLIQFCHHPLFSREHILAQKLKELLIKHKKRLELNNLTRCNGRLEALRRMRDNMKVAIDDGNCDAQTPILLQRYEEDIKEVRRIRNQEGQMDKELIKKILMTWNDIKQMRESQGYQNTNIKLCVTQKVPKDVIAETITWEHEIEKEAKEIFDELKNQNDHYKRIFEEKHQEWIKRKGEKRVKRKSTSPDSDDSEKRTLNSESMENSDPEDEEPRPPVTLVLSNIQKEVSETYKNCFRQPGEPEFEFSITTSNNKIRNSCNSRENLRRCAVKRQNIFLKIFYNDKEVCRSKSFPLSPRFSVALSQRFAIRILEWPESLMIEIHEDSGSFSKNLMVTGIYLPFPSSFTTVENSEIQRHEFSSNISVLYSHTAVGSGISIVPYPDGSEYNNRPVCLYTSGTISYRMGWMENHGNILTPPEKYWASKREKLNMDVREVINLRESVELSRLKDWAEMSNLDPNDPQNSIFFHFLQAMEFKTSEALCFRLDPFQSDFVFCNESHIINNLRLKLLIFRNDGELEFRGVRMVPLNEKLIHKDIFKGFEKRTTPSPTSVELMPADQLDGHRAWGKTYLEEVRQRVLKEYRIAKQHKKLHEVVCEESVPDLGTLGLTFMKWLRPRRPLRPIRKERKRVTPQNLTGQDIKIIVNIVRAFEVPVRKDMDGLSQTDVFSLINVRPFVEITFLNNTARTTAADGPNPTWNQDLQIPLNLKNSALSLANLQSMKDTLYLHLFDEIVVDLIDDETQRETNIHQRFERRWLASMEIPFSTLYYNSRIEGTFKLYSPPVLLGYEREAHRRQFSGSTVQEPLLPQRDATYITLFATVQPPLNPPDPIKEKLDSKETMDLEKHLEGWQKEIRELFPHRKVKTLVMDISAKTVCVTRFIKPLIPPQFGNDNEETTPEMAARYVAMIPSIAGSTFFPGLFDIWLTADQVLRLLSGDSEDHAVLLCSYFLHLGLNAYMLLGSGIPHGPTAYVLVKESSNAVTEHFVWDATNGQKYNISDSFCPLQKIYCVFNNENIWANIQQEEIPRRTKFDFTKRNDWFPAFGKNVTAAIETVQPEFLDYRPTSRQAVEILQDKMEKRLRDSIMKWRKKRRTHWNRYCSATLRKLLPKLEESVWNIKDHTPDHVSELQHILASHKMCGFPINMAYTDMDAVVGAVKATGVHCNENDQVEFALSVYVHSYPNDVLSVWIYVASLVRRR